MKTHKFADIFPMMNEEEYQGLKKDIQENGLIESIETYEGQILDGRNRYKACEEIGIKPLIIEYKGKDALQHIISKNLHRRHLNESQRGLVASRLANLSEGRPSKTSPIGKVSREQASKLLNIGTRTIDRVREIEAKKPEEIERIERGEVSVGKIYGELKKEEADFPEWLRFLDVWNFKENTGDGLSNLPPEVIKNLLYYYTEEGDLVFDCFAGSGQTYKIAKEMNRECVCSDISSTEDFIIKWDVEKGFKNFPEDLENVKLVFLDPPYWNIVDYGEGWSNTSLKEFYEKFNRFLKDLKGILKKDGKVALIIMPLKKEEYIDLGIECYKLFQKNGFKIKQRLCVPLMRNWALDPRVKKSKENKEIVTGSLRDLIIFENAKM